MVRRLLITLTAVTTFVALWASAAAAYAPPEILETFSPTGVVPGRWRLATPDRAVQMPVGTDAACGGRVRGWSRPDGVQLVFSWVSCGRNEIDALLDGMGLDRVGQPATDRRRSVLAEGADVVFTRSDGTVVRAWIQDTYRMDIGTHCAALSTDACAELSATAARHISSRLPGEPRVTDTALLAGPTGLLGGLLSGCLLTWLLVVGARMLQNAANTPRLPGNPADRRLVNIDGSARRLRRAARGHRWGQALLFAGASVGLLCVPSIVRGAAAPAVVFGVVAVVTVGAGLVVVRHWRHPLLTAAWLSRGFRLGVPRPRRLLSGR